jgi:pimeloyl-ACP methyl ester carboxylesterase
MDCASEETGAFMGKKRAAAAPPNLRGWSSLVIEAALGVTHLAEKTHLAILGLTAPVSAPIAGVTRLVYRCVKGVMQLTGAATDIALAQTGEQLDDIAAPPARDAAQAALNGVVGDYLVETRNPLALAMQLRQDGRPLELTPEALAALQPTPRLLVLIHGLCVSDRRWERNGGGVGALLAQKLGFTPIYLFYNSGRHISENGRAAAQLIEELAASWPVPIEDFAIIGHSMGGLVARSACHYGEVAGHEWRRRLKSMIFLGTPHQGAPLERIGHWIDLVLAKIPIAAALGGVSKIRSAAVTDLRYGALVDEDWQGRDRFAPHGDRRHPVPLPEGVACYAIAATSAKTTGGIYDRLVGDGLVTVASALGHHKNRARDLGLPPENQWIACGMHHFDLIDRVEVYEQVASWLEA